MYGDWLECRRRDLGRKGKRMDRGERKSGEKKKKKGRESGRGREREMREEDRRYIDHNINLQHNVPQRIKR